MKINVEDLTGSNSSLDQISVHTALEGGHLVISVEKQAHAATLITNLPSQLRDVTLHTKDGGKIRVHGALLQAVSPGLTLDAEDFIVPEVSAKTLQALEGFLYRPGSFVDAKVSWNELLDMAAYLQMDHLVDGTLNMEFLLDSLQDLFTRDVQTFFLVKSQDFEFPCHEAILAASSPIMKSKVMTSAQHYATQGIRCMNITEGSPTAVSLLLNFIYSGELKLQPDNVFDVFELAVCYQYPVIIQLCTSYILSLMSFSCGIEFYHTAQGLASKYCGDAGATELVTVLNAWLCLNFVPVMEDAWSLIQMTEADWMELLPWAYLTCTWSIEEMICRVVTWYQHEQKHGQQAGQAGQALGRLMGLISNLVERTEDTEASKQLVETLEALLGLWRKPLDSPPMAEHCQIFHKQRAYEKNLRLSEELEKEKEKLLSRSAQCLLGVEEHLETQRQQVLKCYQTYQQLQVEHDRIINQMTQNQQQLQLQKQEIQHKDHFLQEEKKRQDLEEQQVNHNQTLINKRNEDIKKQIAAMHAEFQKQNERRQGIEAEEGDLKDRQANLEENLKLCEKHEEELQQKQDELEARAAEQEQEELRLNKKDEELKKRQEAQKASEDTLKQKDEALKKFGEKLIQERADLNKQRDDLKMEKTEHEKELMKNRETFNKRLAQLEKNTEGAVADYKKQLDTNAKAQQDQKKAMEQELKDLKAKQDEQAKLISQLMHLPA